MSLLRTDLSEVFKSKIKKISSISLIYLIVLLIRSANALFIYSLSISYGITTFLQGIIQGAYSLVEGLSGFIGGLVYDRSGPVKTLIMASILITISYTLSSLIYLYRADPRELIFPQIIAGLSASFLMTTSIALIAEETYGVSRRKRLFGVGGLEISNLSGYVVGFLIAALIEFYSPEFIKGFIPSLLLALIAFIISIVLSTMIRDYHGVAKISSRNLFYVERRSLYLFPMWLGISILLGVAFVSVKILRNIVSESIIYSPNTATELSHGLSIYVALTALLLSLGILLGSYLSSLFEKTKTLLIGSLATPVALISLGYFINNIIARGTTLMNMKLKTFIYPEILIPLTTALVGALLALMLPPSLLALLAEFTDTTRIRGLSSGIYVTTLGIGIFVGNILGGSIYDHFGLIPLTYIISAIFTPLSLITYVFVKRSLRGRVFG